MQNKLNETLKKIAPLNRDKMSKAQEKLDGLLKPTGSLGKLEDIALQLAGIYETELPQIEKKAVVMMAADNGVYEEGFNSYPQEITQAVAELAGPGLVGISVLARHSGARLVVVDLGIKDDVKGGHIINRKIRKSTGNIAKGPAMSKDEALKAIVTGIEITESLILEGVGVLGTGEVGICNTTTSAAVIAALTGTSAENVVGKGTGADDQAYHNKLQAVSNALRINSPDPTDPLDVLARVGGLDIAGLTGCFLAAAAHRKPIVIDGFISGAAALLAVKLNPLARDYMIPSHLSAEKGAKEVFFHLGFEPMLLMNMRLGEGTGAALAFNLIDAACRIINEMGSFTDIQQ